MSTNKQHTLFYTKGEDGDISVDRLYKYTERGGGVGAMGGPTSTRGEKDFLYYGTIRNMITASSFLFHQKGDTSLVKKKR